MDCLQSNIEEEKEIDVNINSIHISDYDGIDSKSNFNSINTNNINIDNINNSKNKDTLNKFFDFNFNLSLLNCL